MQLGSSLQDRLITPPDPRYGEMCRMWNGLLDPRPAAIAECRSTDDVAAAIRIARGRGLTISVRGGGHGVAGRACRDGSLVIDLRGMRRVSVDPARRTAVAEGGATWADFDQATAAHGLASTGGMISSTGVGGLTLGGGVGWLLRSCGLACDNLIGAEIVTADGAIRRVSAEDDPELLWALRGAGIGLGVVTMLEFRLHPISTVVAGMVMHPVDRAGDALRFFRDFCAGAPDQLTTVGAFTFAPPAPFVPDDLQRKPVVAIGVCWSGEVSGAESVIAPLRAFGAPRVNTIGPMRYVDTQTMLDPTSPEHQLNYWKSSFLPALTDDVIARLVARGTSLPSALSQIHLHQLGGVAGRVPPQATAFEQRSAAFVVNIPTMWSNPDQTDSMVAWTREAHADLMASSGGRAYVNFQDRDERSADAWSVSAKERLRSLKERLDPERLFGPDPAE